MKEPPSLHRLRGAELVGAHGARWIAQAASVVRLLGAEFVLSGIPPQAARHYVDALQGSADVRSHGTLEAAVGAALRRRR
ncbi:hypothetical protein ACMHYB_15410 [Sorangium sp. So ce1128]